MIVRCPSCNSRRDLPPLEAGTGAMLVNCPHCGHAWIEGMALPKAEEGAVPVAAEQELAADVLLAAARAARNEFARRRRLRCARRAAWGGLALLTLSPLIAAAALPEQVAAAFPATIGVYERMGREMNIHGLEIRHVDVQHIIVEGRKVIAVKGEVVNTSTSWRNVAPLRFGLRASGNAEVDHWVLDTRAGPLKPGESTSFVTRFTSPPEAARNLEIRFARADEIGSNASP